MAAPVRVGLPLLAWMRLMRVAVILYVAHPGAFMNILVLLLTDLMPVRRRAHTPRSPDVRLSSWDDATCQQLTGFRKRDTPWWSFEVYDFMTTSANKSFFS